ncbi:MAG: phage holin family protein [Bacteroidota bacterium]
MRLRYSYHSEHHAEPRDRWIHFLLFIGAFALLLAAGQQFFLYFTDWHAADDEHSWWHLILALVYLLIGGVLAYLGYRQEHASRGAIDRYVRVGEDDLVWSLTQRTDEEKIKLADVAAVERLNIRDLKITLKDGTVAILPIFLVANAEKQAELIQVLTDNITA